MTDGDGRMCYTLDREVVAEKEGFVVWELIDGFWYEQLNTAHQH